MTTRILNRARTHSLFVFLAHVWLAAFSPFLHAHSTLPIGHPAGMHVHIEVRSGADEYCPLSGLPAGTLTAEVCDSRVAKEEAFCAHAPAADQAAPVALSSRTHVSLHFAVHANWHGENPPPRMPGTVPGIAASPQAP